MPRGGARPRTEQHSKSVRLSNQKRSAEARCAKLQDEAGLQATKYFGSLQPSRIDEQYDLVQVGNFIANDVEMLQCMHRAPLIETLP